MKWYFTQKNNRVSGFYNTEANHIIPDDAIETTEDSVLEASHAEANGKALCVTNNKIDPQPYPTEISNWDGISKWIPDTVAINKNKIIFLKKQLEDIDNKSQRCLRAVMASLASKAVPNALDVSSLNSYEEQAIELRAQISELSK